MRVEKLFVRDFFATNNNVRAAEVTFKSGAEDVNLLPEVVRIVGNATVGGKLASGGELDKGGLVV